jgi:hypothetical protein
VICTGSFFFIIGLFPLTSSSVYLRFFSLHLRALLRRGWIWSKPEEKSSSSSSIDSCFLLFVHECIECLAMAGKPQGCSWMSCLYREYQHPGEESWRSWRKIPPRIPCHIFEAGERGRGEGVFLWVCVTSLWRVLWDKGRWSRKRWEGKGNPGCVCWGCGCLFRFCGLCG